MIYYGTEKTETIYFYHEDDSSEVHCIVMEMDGDESVFYVRTCCNPEWDWKFWYTPSNYDMVKHAIWDVGFDSENIDEALRTLDGYFEEIFNSIVIWDECECTNGCKNCNCK